MKVPRRHKHVGRTFFQTRFQQALKKWHDPPKKKCGHAESLHVFNRQHFVRRRWRPPSTDIFRKRPREPAERPSWRTSKQLFQNSFANTVFACFCNVFPALIFSHFLGLIFPPLTQTGKLSVLPWPQIFAVICPALFAPCPCAGSSFSFRLFSIAFYCISLSLSLCLSLSLSFWFSQFSTGAVRGVESWMRSGLLHSADNRPGLESMMAKHGLQLQERSLILQRAALTKLSLPGCCGWLARYTLFINSIATRHF